MINIYLTGSNVQLYDVIALSDKLKDKTDKDIRVLSSDYFSLEREKRNILIKDTIEKICQVVVYIDTDVCYGTGVAYSNGKNVVFSYRDFFKILDSLEWDATVNNVADITEFLSNPFLIGDWNVLSDIVKKTATNAANNTILERTKTS